MYEISGENAISSLQGTCTTWQENDVATVPPNRALVTSEVGVFAYGPLALARYHRRLILPMPLPTVSRFVADLEHHVFGGVTESL